MDINDLRAFEADTKKLVSGFEIAWKTNSRSQRVISWLLWVFNPRYLTNYATTFYPRVYFPSKEAYESSPNSSFTILAHERVHLLDSSRNPLWFRVSYLLPQCISLPLLGLAILFASMSLWISLFFVFLAIICLAPWPSFWRVHWEKRGYAMSMAVSYWITGTIPVSLLDRIRERFLGWDYYLMACDKWGIDSWLIQVARSIQDGTILADPVYADVYRFIRDRRISK